jgi:hypothetical protein
MIRDYNLSGFLETIPVLWFTGSSVPVPQNMGPFIVVTFNTIVFYGHDFYKGISNPRVWRKAETCKIYNFKISMNQRIALYIVGIYSYRFPPYLSTHNQNLGDI